MPQTAKSLPITVEEGVHVKLGGSTAEQWMNCLRSPLMKDRAPKQESSFYADEGTAAHEIASRVLTGKEPAGGFKPGQILLVKRGGKTQKIDITDDMLEAVQIYVDYIRSRIEEYGLTKQHIFIERWLAIPNPFGMKLGGTADATLHVPYDRLIVADYKHGAGVKVEIAKNYQTRFYGIAAYFSLPEHARENIHFIELVIAQPRVFGGGIMTEIITVEELLEFKERMFEAIPRTSDPNAPLKAGKWCRWCPAKPICPAFTDLIQEQAAIDFTDEKLLPSVVRQQLPNVLTWSREQIAKALEVWPLIEEFGKALRSHAHWMAESGDAPDGWVLEGSLGNRAYSDKTEAKKVLEPILGGIIYGTAPLRGPKQIENEIKRVNKDRKKAKQPLIDMKILDALVYRPDNGNKLVRTENARGIKKHSAASDFDGLDIIDAEDVVELDF